MTDDRTYALLCPDGYEIRATLEVVSARCDLDEGSIRPSDEARFGFDFEWGGETDVDYDSETTLEVEGIRQFLCSEFDQHGEDELKLVVEDEDGEWVEPTRELGLV